MKNYINKSAKRAISLALAFVLLIGTLFTANVGVNIKAGAETTDSYADWDNVQCWEGNYLSDYSSFKQEDVDGDGVKEYIIENAAQLQFAAAGIRANQNTTNASWGKSFAISDKVDAFIMQPKAAVDKLGIAAFVEASSAEETRKFFEETYTAAGFTPVNWVKDSTTNIFAGDFDGSGVPIYGLYADGIAKTNEHAGFFLATNKGSSTDGSIELKNIVIKNSYFKSYRRVGILIGTTWGGDDGYAKVDSCIFANCYLFGQNKYTNGSTTCLRSGTNSGEFTSAHTEMGIVAGSVASDPIQMSNTLVYGNKCRYDFYTASDMTQDLSNGWVYTVNNTGTITGPTTTHDLFNWVFKDNKGGTYKGSLKNSIILDTQVNNLTDGSTTYCENVYSNTYSPYTTVTNIIDAASAKGAHGRYYMSLGWDSAWWAIENDYPTPIKPSDSYVSVAAKEFEGSGTEADPYLIYSAKQLDKMVSEGGIRNSVRSHYKVADSVKEIYLNDAKTKEEAIALYADNTGKFNNWLHYTTGTDGETIINTAFEGHFDGNGVTIYGMISSNRGRNGNVGFVPRLGSTKDGTTADTVTIKNVNFVGAYINANGVAAVVTSGVVGYKETTSDGAEFDTTNWGSNDIKHTSYITSVTVRDSYVYSTNKSFATEGATSHNGSAAGILALSETPDHVVISNCLYDGGSCVLEDGDTTAGVANTAKAGIVSMYSGGNEFTLENCVSIDEYAIPMVSGITAYRYGSGTTSALQFNTVYGKLNAEFDITTTTYDKLANCYAVEAGKTTFAMLDMPMLNWGGAWTLETLADGRTIPMPKTSDKAVDAYSTQLVKQNNGKGATLPDKTRPGGYKNGTYGMYEEFLGSGTKEDPYIISNALDLARAIACGGKDITTKLYYKLSCDIDVGAGWINEQTIEGKYVYVPFEGTLDGDGHTIYNLYSISNGGNAGLIPQIVEGATIKNLHIRDSYICSSTADAGAFGAYKDDPNSTVDKVYIEGCSFESDNSDSVQNLVGGTANATITNSYYVVGDNSAYYLADSNIGTPTPDYKGDNADTAVWYKGGKDDCKPQLVNRAKAMTEVDISGYGDNDYDSNDIASLRQRLLDNPAYANVYGDVSRNGVTNMGDLAILARQLVGTYNMYADGFWRNAALGNIVIYYGENDNYDFARKLELALEDEFGKDVKKVVVGTGSIDSVSYGSKSGGLYVHKNDIYTNGTNYYKFSEDASTGAITPVQITASAEISKYALDGNCQIVVGNIGTSYSASLDDNNYQITYNKANSAVWLQGGSFTAVEQATLDFINKSNPDSSYVYNADGAVATLDPNKVAKTVDGEPYYYAWGDEFNSNTLEKDKWNYCTMHNETDNADSGWFNNLEVAFPEDFEKLYEIEIDDSTKNGKLKIWRGYYGAYNSNYDWGYKNLGTLADKGVKSDTSVDNGFGDTVDNDDIYASAGKILTNKSMLVKQGYLEMKATYPSDNHAFTCWWLLGHHNVANTYQSNSLFGKVFKLNNEAAYTNSTNADLYAYDGTTETLNSSDPSTFKYQLPSASYEIDIAELMQSANADVDANFTFHKFYRNGVYTNADGKNAIKFIDWDYVTTGTKNSKNTVAGPHYTLSFNQGFKETYEFSLASFDYKYKSTSTTSMTPTNISEFLYDSEVQYSGDTTRGKTYDTYNGEMIGTHQGAQDSVNTPHFSKTEGTVALDGGQEYIFGVKWDASNANAIFTFTVTKVGETEPIKTVTVADNIAYNEDKSGTIDTFLSQVSNLETDQQTANQYMYMLIDNVFYSSNSSGTAWSNLLTEQSGDTTVMEIDYVRVYQQKRDIVTPDTEEFNNGNHFGY